MLRGASLIAPQNEQIWSWRVLANVSKEFPYCCTAFSTFTDPGGGGGISNDFKFFKTFFFFFKKNKHIAITLKWNSHQNATYAFFVNVYESNLRVKE